MSSSPINRSQSTMPLRTVSLTVAPNPTAPTNSNIPAITVACFRVIARDPTEVAKQFATSFAPIPHAIAKQTNPPNTTNHRNSSIWSVPMPFVRASIVLVIRSDMMQLEESSG